MTRGSGRRGASRESHENGRLSERGWGITRADALFVICSLALAAGIGVWQWGGIGHRNPAGGSANTSEAVDALSSGGTGSEGTGGGGDSGDAAPTGQEPSASEDTGEAPPGGLYAVVQDTEGHHEVLPLWVDATVTVENSLGRNVVEVSEGAVRVSEADCSNQTCVNMGWAVLEGQTITCLPHKLVVQVVSDPADAAPLS